MVLWTTEPHCTVSTIPRGLLTSLSLLITEDGSLAQNLHNRNVPSECDLTSSPRGKHSWPYIPEQLPSQLSMPVTWTAAATSVGQKMLSGWSKAKVARQEGKVACLSIALGRPQNLHPTA